MDVGIHRGATGADKQQRYDELQAALQHAGTNALPVVLDWLYAKDGTIRVKLISFAQKHPQLRLRFVSADEKITVAVIAFHTLGPSGKAAVPRLIEFFHHENSRDKVLAAVTLREIGPEARAAVPELKEYIRTNTTDKTSTYLSGISVREVVQETLRLIDTSTTKSAP